MKSTTFALGSLLATVAFAQPHRHAQLHHKRADGAPVVWETVTVDVYETDYVTTTIWVTPGQSIPAQQTEAPAPSAVPAQFFQPKPADDSAPAPVASSSSIQVAPVIQASQPAAEVPAANVESSAPAVVVPTTPEVASTTAPAPVAVPATSSAAAVVAPASSSPAASSSSSSSSSSSGNTVTGTNTGTIFQFGDAAAARKLFYENGSCGLSTYFASSVDASMPLVAMPSQVMSSYGSSQYNKLCGKVATLTSRGKTKQVVVADTNVSAENSIDMTSDVWTFFGQTDGDGSHADFEIQWSIAL